MANIKVSELPSATSLNDEDLVMIVQNNESKKISGEDLFEEFNNNIEDSGWIILNDAIKYRKVGKVVYVIGQSDGSVSIGNDEYTDVGILPENYRPTVAAPFVAHFVGGTPVGQSNYITTSGAIKMYLPANVTQSYWQFSVCYPI